MSIHSDPGIDSFFRSFSAPKTVPIGLIIARPTYVTRTAMCRGDKYIYRKTYRAIGGRHDNEAINNCSENRLRVVDRVRQYRYNIWSVMPRVPSYCSLNSQFCFETKKIRTIPETFYNPLSILHTVPKTRGGREPTRERYFSKTNAFVRCVQRCNDVSSRMRRRRTVAVLPLSMMCINSNNLYESKTFFSCVNSHTAIDPSRPKKTPAITLPSDSVRLSGFGSEYFH